MPDVDGVQNVLVKENREQCCIYNIVREPVLE